MRSRVLLIAATALAALAGLLLFSGSSREGGESPLTAPGQPPVARDAPAERAADQQPMPTQPENIPADLPERLARLDTTSQQSLRKKIHEKTMLKLNSLDKAARHYLGWSPGNLKQQGLSDGAVRRLMAQRALVLETMIKHCEQASR